MGMKIVGISAVKAMIINDADKASKAVLRQMRKEAAIIVTLAKQYAPVDVGNLEKSIRSAENRSTGRTRIIFLVGGSYGGRDVDEYAERLHEGFYKLGPKSLEKARLSGKLVGRKFLERALNERRAEIIRAAQKAARDAI